MLENIAFLPTKRAKNHVIINIESGGRGELASCSNSFVWDCRSLVKTLLRWDIISTSELKLTKMDYLKVQAKK